MPSLLSFLISSLCNPPFHFILFNSPLPPFPPSLSIYSILSLYPFSFLTSLSITFPCFSSSLLLITCPYPFRPLTFYYPLFLSLSLTFAAPSPLHTPLLLSCLSIPLFLLDSTEQIHQSFSEVSSLEQNTDWQPCFMSTLCECMCLFLMDYITLIVIH